MKLSQEVLYSQKPKSLVEKQEALCYGKIEYVASDGYTEVLRHIETDEQINAVGFANEVMLIIEAVNIAHREGLKEFATF